MHFFRSALRRLLNRFLFVHSIFFQIEWLFLVLLGSFPSFLLFGLLVLDPLVLLPPLLLPCSLLFLLSLLLLFSLLVLFLPNLLVSFILLLILLLERLHI